MNRIAWPSLARAQAWILAAAFLLATILYAVLVFVPIGTHPEPGEDFLENVIADFEYGQGLWPLEFAGTALFALGFLALAALGPTFGSMADPDDGRRGLVAAGLVLAGGLGAASQLLWIGVVPVATSPQYCECGLLAEEIMARLMILNVAGGIQMWLVSGAVIAAAVGIVAGGTLGRDAGMPAGWLWLSLGIAALAVVAAGLPLFEVYPVDVILVIVLAGILLPIWALWLAARAWTIWPNAEAEEAEIEVVET